jgi:hypothetical protein
MQEPDILSTPMLTMGREKAGEQANSQAGRGLWKLSLNSICIYSEERNRFLLPQLASSSALALTTAT